MTGKELFNPSCKSCPRLSRHLATVRREFPDYHAAPVPPFGVNKPQLLIVGLAPGLHGANATGRPFTGDHAGIILYKTLFKYGFSTGEISVSATDKLRLKRCRITNAVKCLPPENKPTTAEVVKCNSYLSNEITSLPQDTVIMVLGSIAHGAVLRALGLRVKTYPFAHGHFHSLEGGRRLLDSYHCSRYNTNTRRLTPAMFDAVFERAVGLLGD
jgi:uracil-DNA glycosylase family 4